MRDEPQASSELKPDAAQPNLLDLSMKALWRQVPAAVLELAGVSVDPASISIRDVSIILPEFRADQVLVVGVEADPSRRAVYFEFQSQPDPRLLPTWFLKNAALRKQLGCPVFLVAIYLEKGDRTEFPDGFEETWGSLRNDFGFTAIRLWEHGERIRRSLPELAPVLVLCEDNPTERTVQEKVELIRSLGVAEETRADLLAVAYMLGTRRFLRGVLDALFREEIGMAVDLYKDLGMISDWLNEALEKGWARGEAEGRAGGEARGETEEARRIALRLLRRRFGDLPATLVERIDNADARWCEELIERAVQVETIQELLDSLS